MRYSLRLLLASSVLLLLTSNCGLLQSGILSPKPPTHFIEANLIGTWNAYGTYYPETLTLNEDHSFIYRYASSPPVKHRGVWHIEPRASGCVYLHLEGMSYVHGTDSEANNGGRYPNGSPVMYWEQCEDQPISMLDEVILVVGSDPKAERMLVLNYPRRNSEGNDLFLYLRSSS
jgi:hypothetical protein